MPGIQWSEWQDSGGNGMRVGIDVSTSAVTTSSTTVTFTYKVYTENRTGYPSDVQVLSYGGSFTGSSFFNYTNVEGAGAVLRDTKTFTFTYSTYGTSPGTTTFSATVGATDNGVAPNKNVTTVIPARPYDVPIAPSSVTATRNSDTQATVGWVRNVTVQKPYTSLTVQMRTFLTAWSDWATVATTTATATSYVKTGLQANRAYEFRVRSNNGAGSSAFVSSPSVYMTPAAPSGLVAGRLPGGTTIGLSWVNNHYLYSGITLTIERSVAGGAYAVLASGISHTVSSFVDSTPGVGTNQYRIKAVVTTLSSAYVTSNVVTTAVAPLAPTSLVPNGGAVDFTLPQTFTWQHNPGTDGAAQSAFTLETSIDGGANWIIRANNVASTVSSYTMPAGTLVNGNSYLWRVRTVGIASAGSSPNSANATIVGHLTPVVTITAPTGVTTSLPIVATWTYSQAQGSIQSGVEVWLYAADGVTLLFHDTGFGSPAPSSKTLNYPFQDGELYVVKVQSTSASGVKSNLASVMTRIAISVPAAITSTGEYQPCTGSAVLHLAANTPESALTNRFNQNTNPAFRVAPLTEIRRNLALSAGYRAASGASVTIRQNLVRNPSCNVNGIDWVATPAGQGTTTNTRETVDIHPAFTAYYRMKWATITGGSVTGTGIAIGSSATDAISGIQTTPNLLQVSCYVRSNHPGRTARLQVSVYDSGGVQVGSTVNSATVDVSGGWTRLGMALVPAAPATRVMVFVAGVGGTNWAVNDTLEAGGLLVEQGQAMLNYFDGDTPDSLVLPELDYAWLGTAGASKSVLRSVANLPLLTSFEGYQRGSWVKTTGAADGTGTLRTMLGAVSTNQSLVMFTPTASILCSPGDVVGARFRIRQVPGTNVNNLVFNTNLTAYTSGSSVISAIASQNGVTVPADGTWVDITLPSGVCPATTHHVRLQALCGSDIATNAAAVIEISNVLVEKGSLGTWFDGNSTSGNIVYSWAGAANTTASIASAPQATSYVATLIPALTGTYWVDVTANRSYLQTGGAATKTVLATPAVAAIGQASPGVHVVTRVTSDVNTTIVTYAEFGAAASGQVKTTHVLTAGVPLDINQTYLNSAVPGAGTTGRWYIGWDTPVATPTSPVTLTVEPILLAPNGDVGGYFDGSSISIPTYAYVWDGTPDASSSTASGRSEVPAVAATIERRVEGTDDWTTLITAMPLPNDFVDALPLTNGSNEYRITSVSSIPSYRINTPTLFIEGTDGQGAFEDGDGLWVFLSYGDAFTTLLRFHCDPQISDTAGRARVAQPFLGRRKPVLLVGANVSREISVSGALRWDEDCPVDDDCSYDSPTSDWITAAQDAELVCYRDYTGRRLFGMLSDMSVSDVLHKGYGSVGFKVTETDFTEAYG